MSTSQNGWPVLPRGSSLDNAPVAGVKLSPGVRSGDVAVVLHWIAQQVNDRVEKLHAGWCWGYAYRAIRGQTSGYSNHASATAIDLNAPDHGRQSSSPHLGYTAAQVAEIHRILTACAGLVRWGGDYSPGPYDPMHFEINGTPAQIAALAGKLRTLPTQEDLTIVDANTKAFLIAQFKAVNMQLTGTYVVDDDADPTTPRVSIIQMLENMNARIVQIEKKLAATP